MLTVHHLGISQSDRAVWLCEELEIPYALQRYERDPVTRAAPPAYKALHPAGTAPVITDGDIALGESGAVLDYIIGRYGDGRLLNRGAGRSAAVMNLGEEPQLADAGGPRDGDFGVGVHRERHHAVDIARSQTRILKRVQHRLGGQPKFTAAGVLREVGGADPNDRRLSGQLTRHQAIPPTVNVEVAITWSPRPLLPTTFTVITPSSIAVTSPLKVTVS